MERTTGFELATLTLAGTRIWSRWSVQSVQCAAVGDSCTQSAECAPFQCQWSNALHYDDFAERAANPGSGPVAVTMRGRSYRSVQASRRSEVPFADGWSALTAWAICVPPNGTSGQVGSLETVNARASTGDPCSLAQ